MFYAIREVPPRHLWLSPKAFQTRIADGRGLTIDQQITLLPAESRPYGSPTLGHGSDSHSVFHGNTPRGLVSDRGVPSPWDVRSKLQVRARLVYRRSLSLIEVFYNRLSTNTDTVKKPTNQGLYDKFAIV